MPYYVVYEAKVQRRVREDGYVQHYVHVGVYYTEQALKDSGAIRWTKHETEGDASGTWDTYCSGMNKRWPRRAGMDVAEQEKYRQVRDGSLTLDSEHLKTKVDRNEPPPRLF
jgi:hypothetical protein